MVRKELAGGRALFCRRATKLPALPGVGDGLPIARHRAIETFRILTATLPHFVTRL